MLINMYRENVFPGIPYLTFEISGVFLGTIPPYFFLITSSYRRQYVIQKKAWESLKIGRLSI